LRLIVGTRGSKLAIAQTVSVIQELKKFFPEIEISIKIIKTLGDRLVEKPLASIHRKGIFEKEIDKAILNEEIDFAVHSMKDVPISFSRDLMIVAVPKRGPPYDVLISNKNLKLNELPSGSIIGTSSLRRAAQILHVRPDLIIKSIRGNIDTRIMKLKQKDFDAIVLAEAGLYRLKMQNYITERLSLKEFTPAPGQGALAVVVRKDNKKIINILKHINHPLSMAEAFAERAFLQGIGSWCNLPIGAIAKSYNGNLSIVCSILSFDGRLKLQFSEVGSIKSPEKLGKKAAQKAIKLGVKGLIKHYY
jgi:hydroxymethylbilane synthase